MKIVVMGAPMTCGNRGVLALGASVANLCLRAEPNAKITFLIVHRDNHPVSIRIGGTICQFPVTNARMSPRAPLHEHLLWILLMSSLYRLVPIRAFRRLIQRRSPWIQTIVEADFIGDIRGGDGFSDIYGLVQFLRSSAAVLTVLLIKGNIVQFPQTFGPYRTAIARGVARLILRRSSVILARDRISADVARTLGGPRSRVTLCPDVAFSLAAVRPNPIVLRPSLPHWPESPVIGVNINGLVFSSSATGANPFKLTVDYCSLATSVIETLLRESYGELWLISHTSTPGQADSDPEACETVYRGISSELQSRIRIVDSGYDQNEIKGIISRLDFFVGSRMHACIAALSQGVPCVGIAYSRKFEGVFETVGMSHCVIDAARASNEEAMRKLVTLYRKRHEIRPVLGSRAELVRQQLDQTFQKTISAVCNHNVCSPVVHGCATSPRSVTLRESENQHSRN